MSRATWTPGDRLPEATRRQVLGWFVYRMTRENARSNPGAVRRVLAGGYRLAPVSDTQWLREHEFPLTRSGRLDVRYRGCRSTVPREVWSARVLTPEEARRQWGELLGGRP